MGYTIKTLREQFPDDDACLDYLFHLIHGKNECCSKCGSKKPYKRVKGRRSYQCTKCYHQVYPTANTPLRKTTTPLTYWVFAIFLFTTSKNGLSACELQRHLGVTYKTAFRMLRQIRKLIKLDDNLFEGVIQTDETFVGGKNKNRHKDKKVKNSQGRSFKDKTPVHGILSENKYELIISKTGKLRKNITQISQVKCFVVPNTKASSIQPIIRDNVAFGSIIVSDEWWAYQGLNKDYNHEVVDHKRKQYVNENGDTTNAIEGVWSILKRTINGSYIHVSKKYMQLYINEVVFRFNNRNNENMFSLLLNGVAS